MKTTFETACALFYNFFTEVSKGNGTLQQKMDNSPILKEIAAYGKEILPHLGEFLRYYKYAENEQKDRYAPYFSALCGWVTAQFADLPGPLPDPTGNLEMWIEWLLSPPITTYAEIGLFLHQDSKISAGFYGNIYDVEIYKSEKDAIAKNDYAVVKTLQSNIGLLFYHVYSPKTKKEFYVRFTNQDPRFGEDAEDNTIMQNAVSLALGYVNPQSN